MLPGQLLRRLNNTKVRSQTGATQQPKSLKNCYVVVNYYQYLRVEKRNAWFSSSMTEKMQLQRSFLRNPINSIGILLAIALLFEGFGWAAIYSNKIKVVNELGGGVAYVSYFARVIVFPEICTLYILIKLIDWYHKVRHIDSVNLNWNSLPRYEARILPILLIAFFVFNPFTQSVRYILEAFPDYSLDKYWSKYILGTYTIRVYIRYLVPVLLIGYAAVNGSLIIDYMAYREAVEKEAEAELQLKLAQATTPKMPVKSDFLTTVKGRNAQGEMIFPVDECCYFMVEDRYYYVIHPKGRYMVSKTINELEAELDPAQFFRANRGAILNRRTVQSYAYWERGKYIVRLNSTCEQAEIVLPRARLQEFRDWLGGEVIASDQLSTGTLLTGSF